MKYTLIFLISFLLSLLVINSCEHQSATVNFIKSHEPKRQDTPFSDVVIVDNLLFLSGQIGRDHSKGALVEGGIKAQTRQTIENIKAVLAHNQSDLSHVVKCTVILSDIQDFDAFNEIYKQYFPNKPARTTFAASGLAAGALIEIEVVAVKP
ncbi:MAG: reactive intermediate/imine deaminase [Bacteroidetes bacterium HGW-Bacteroidetes-13]|jgi:2-iminobutanoate/2-iminopropanoate deaminase|nr:MAG: reactive intermediate/imine deaminase [Bacteroidetes bacterium HGW-Bacteroidetes-13]